MRSHALPRRAARPVAAAIAIALLALGLAGCSRPAPRPHGIVLVVLDTLRADRLSAYGHVRETSPRLHRLAAEGVLFEQAITHSPWTLPAFIGLLSGRYPGEDVYDGRLRVSLVETLRDAGYRTAAFTEGGYVSAYFGIDLGFERFLAEEGDVRLLTGAGLQPGAGAGGVEHTFDTAIAWLDAHAGEPFFLLVHTYEPHTPYLRREFAEGLPRGALPEDVYSIETAGKVGSGEVPAGPEEIEYVRALYDGGIAAADRELGRLLDRLAGLRRDERPGGVVTSGPRQERGGAGATR
mgnify:CR=1 FL=1